MHLAEDIDHNKYQHGAKSDAGHQKREGQAALQPFGGLQRGGQLVGHILVAVPAAARQNAHVTAVGMVVDLFLGGVQQCAAQQQEHRIGQVAQETADQLQKAETLAAQRKSAPDGLTRPSCPRRAASASASTA